MIAERYNRGIQWPILIMVGIFAVLALLLTSWDSYLYDLWQHHDVIWFYMCGKAWMNGLTPYVDFADSKGPLLWIIYGIGYLLSPSSYVGCFWISCILYTIIFYQCYKCALLFTRDNRLALVAVVLSALFFLGNATHIEVRTEDYCYPFMLPLFYRFLRHTINHESNHRFARQSVMLLGLSLGATLLIKYSCTLMMAVFIPYFCLIVPRRCNYPVIKAIGWCALTFVLTLVPMLAVLAAQGCLGAFINEYFLVTANTFGNLHGSAITPGSILFLLTSKRLLIFLAGIAVGMVVYFLRVSKGRVFALIALVWFLAVILLNGTDNIYFNVLSLFTVLFAGLIVQLLGWWLHHRVVIATMAIAVLAALFFMTDRMSLFNQKTQEQTAWYDYAHLMSQYQKPRTLYLSCHDHGEGVPAGALPACKYWSLQVGYTPQMKADQINAITQDKCDVVIVMSDDKEGKELLEAKGFHRYDFTDIGVGEPALPHYLLYSSRELDTSSFKVPTSADVLLKRNICRRN
jgi:hypothetical protein